MTDFLLNPLVARLFYGSVVSAVVGVCWLSKSVALEKVALWSFVSWLGSNLIFGWLGARHAPWLIPGYNAVICAMIAGVAIRYHSSVAWWNVRLFCVEFALVVFAFSLREQGTIAYYVALNLVFLTRMAVTGGAGYVELVRRPDDEHQRARHRLAGAARNQAGAWPRAH
jgi:hypothetical protein